VPSPARGLTQPQRVEISNRRLIEAAAALIAEKGWEATTAAEIGQRVGYSRAMVHARYGTKDAILDAFFLDDQINAVVNPVLKEIRDKTGETACFFKVEQNYRVCVAVAETHTALRRDMYVGKIIPLHVGSASRVLLAWNPDLAETILAAPLEPMTDFTVTSPEELRGLIAAAKADGYAITAGEREDSASGLSAPVFDAAGDILGAITISGPTIRMPHERCVEWVDLAVGHAEQVTRTLGGHLPH
jgi:DNA-binding IclR family transcriptional regulator